MKVISSPQKMQSLSLTLKKKGKTIAVVPTMGYLHEGHLTLLRAARKKADVVVLTLFVNPSQFGPKEDLSRYPRDEKGDLAKARSVGTDYVFMPKTSEMYPARFQTWVEVTSATRELCGKARPGHFRGVTTIVAKLFNIVQPDWAFFGKKDFQQYAVICNMVKDLNLHVKIIGVPTVREKDGLAMSSRNIYLSVEERKAALCLSRGLKKICEAVAKGETNLVALKKIITTTINREPLARIDYIECVAADLIAPLKSYQKNNTLFAMAVFIGKTRLLDNVVV